MTPCDKNRMLCSYTFRSGFLNTGIQGATFLAFGNGAADLFSAIAANSNVQDGNAGMGIGGILGENGGLTH